MRRSRRAGDRARQCPGLAHCCRTRHGCLVLVQLYVDDSNLRVVCEASAAPLGAGRWAPQAGRTGSLSCVWARVGSCSSCGVSWGVERAERPPSLGWHRVSDLPEESAPPAPVLALAALTSVSAPAPAPSTSMRSPRLDVAESCVVPSVLVARRRTTGSRSAPLRWARPWRVRRRGCTGLVEAEGERSL